MVGQSVLEANLAEPILNRMLYQKHHDRSACCKHCTLNSKELRRSQRFNRSDQVRLQPNTSRFQFNDDAIAECDSHPIDTPIDAAPDKKLLFILAEDS